MIFGVNVLLSLTGTAEQTTKLKGEKPVRLVLQQLRSLQNEDGRRQKVLQPMFSSEQW